MDQTLFVIIASFFVPFLAEISGDILGREQSSGAKGTLTCKGEPAGGVKIKLYDDDRGIDADDFMGETKTDSKGYFEISGSTSEFSDIDPKINIYHDCEDILPCQRKLTIKLDSKYIYGGKTPKALADVGTVELEHKFSGEKRDCIN